MSKPIALYMLPYAGGASTSFRQLISRLPAWIEATPITLPGRGSRFREQPITDWHRLVDVLAAEIKLDADQPFALFGHSLGALVALELAHRFRSEGHDRLIWFCASGCVAPRRRKPGEDWLGCEDVQFIDKLKSLEGTPIELLENRELLDLYLPALRADFHLASSYTAVDRRALNARLLILGGDDDAEVVTPRENLSDWELEFSGSNRLDLHAGGHFFIHDHSESIARQTAHDIAAALMLDVSVDV